MLVEDNPKDATMTLGLFQRHRLGNELVHASDGAEAIEMLFGRDAVSPVVVLLDLDLPRVAGIEVLRRIRGNARTRHLPVIILTGTTLDEDYVTSYGLGPEHLHQKTGRLRCVRQSHALARAVLVRVQRPQARLVR